MKRFQKQTTPENQQSIFYLILGLIMGICDSIPGVSSSTIVLLTKKYEFIILIFAKFFTKEFFLEVKEFIFKFHFLNFSEIKNISDKFYLITVLSLLLGITIGFVASFLTIAHFLENYTKETLRVISVIMIFVTLYYVYEYKETFLNEKYYLNYILTGISLIALLFFFSGLGNYGLSIPIVILTAFLSMIAMLLPGISGSLILVLFGLYVPVKNALVDFDIYFLSIYFTGSIIGLIFGLKGIDYLNKHYEVKMKYFLLAVLISATIYLNIISWIV